MARQSSHGAKIISLTFLMAIVYVEMMEPVATEHIKCGDWVNKDASETGHRFGSTRVFDGVQARPGEVPFQAEILVRSRLFDSKRCGGVIIDRRTIITAAHCVHTTVLGTTVLPVNRLRVVVGHLVYPGRDKYQKLDVDEIIVHEHYELDLSGHTETSTNDIAMIKTRQQMSWNLTKSGHGSVNRICLPQHQDMDYEHGQEIFVSGWGDIGHRSIPEHLQIMNTNIVGWNECKRKWDSKKHFLTDAHVCTFVNAKKHIGIGDSGGPVFLRRPNSRQAELVGLVAVSDIPGHDANPDAHTCVSHFIDWIRAKCPECEFN